MPDELIDIVTENNELTGIQKMKSESHRLGLWHRASHVWIYNSQKEILLQLRAKEKSLFPDTWDVSVGGHINADENPLDTAVRETEEELGIKIRKENLEFFKIQQIQAISNEIINNEFMYVYFYRYDGGVASIKLQKGEVAEIKFLPIDKIRTMFIENPQKFTHKQDYLFAVFDAIASHNLSSK